MAEYGWIDLRDGSPDHDSYDEIGAKTLTVLLHTHDGVLTAGARVTVVEADSIAESISARMWPDADRHSIANHRDLTDYFASSDVVDCTRLLLADGAGRAEAIELIGACVAATDGLMGTYMTVHNALVAFFAACRIPVDVIHEGKLDGELSAFVMIPPPKELHVDDLQTRQDLSRGALLVDPLLAPGLSFYSAPDLDLRVETSLEGREDPGPALTMAQVLQR